jgi:hypothetical protein
MIKGVTKREDGRIFAGEYYNTKTLGRRPVFLSPKAFENRLIQSRNKKKRRTKRLAFKFKSIVDRYKLMKGCGHCNYKKIPSVLHFHHVNPKNKLFSIGDKLGRNKHLSYTRWKIIKEEIKKCIILCANCHTEETYMERNKK